MTSIDRRMLLTRGAIGAAALTLTSAAALASVGEDAGLLEHGERCKALALETTRLRKLFRKVCERTEEAFYAMAPERWSCRPGYADAGLVAPVPGVANAWQVFAVDLAPRWFATHLETEQPERLPTKWMPLKARSEAEAKSEADVLDRKLDKAFFEKRKQAGVPFERDAHYHGWSRSHSELRRAVAQLSRLKAATLEGLNMKAMVLAIAHDAFDDPNIWNEPLQKSITRDIRRMAA
jgi:hypothetical protein